MKGGEAGQALLNLVSSEGYYDCATASSVIRTIAAWKTYAAITNSEKANAAFGNDVTLMSHYVGNSKVDAKTDRFAPFGADKQYQRPNPR